MTHDECFIAYSLSSTSSYSNYPRGCSYIGGSYYFNTLTSGGDVCSSSEQCICKCSSTTPSGLGTLAVKREHRDGSVATLWSAAFPDQSSYS